MTNYWAPLEKEFQANANAENAAAMKKYMRGQYDYYGIKTPERKAIEKAFYQNNPLPPKAEMEPLIFEAWNKPQREWVHMGMAFIEKYKKHWSESDVEVIEKLIISKSWWDSVDILCIRIGGTFFKKHPELIESKTKAWIDSDNIWLNRSAILFQLKYKEQTDWQRLQSYILQKSDSTEFFIQKAIGWALREYSKRFPEKVIAFIEANENQLAALSKREGLKWIRQHKTKDKKP